MSQDKIVIYAKLSLSTRLSFAEHFSSHLCHYGNFGSTPLHKTWPRIPFPSLLEGRPPNLTHWCTIFAHQVKEEDGRLILKYFYNHFGLVQPSWYAEIVFILKCRIFMNNFHGTVSLAMIIVSILMIKFFIRQRFQPIASISTISEIIMEIWPTWEYAW